MYEYIVIRGQRHLRILFPFLYTLTHASRFAQPEEEPAVCVLASRFREDSDVVRFFKRGLVADTWTSRVPLLSSNIISKDWLLRTLWSQPRHNANDHFVRFITTEAFGVPRTNRMLYSRGWLVRVRLCPPNNITDRELYRRSGR